MQTVRKAPLKNVTNTMTLRNFDAGIIFENMNYTKLECKQ